MFTIDQIVSFNADSEIPLPSLYAIDSPTSIQQDYHQISQPQLHGNVLQPPPPPNDEDYQFDDIYMEDEEEGHMAAPQDHNEHIPQCLDMNTSSFPQLYPNSFVPGN